MGQIVIMVMQKKWQHASITKMVRRFASMPLKKNHFDFGAHRRQILRLVTYDPLHVIVPIALDYVFGSR